LPRPSGFLRRNSPAGTSECDEINESVSCLPAFDDRMPTGLISRKQAIQKVLKDKENLWIALLLAGLCLITYGNSLHNDFLMDDYPMLIKNQQIGDPSFLQLNIGAHQHQKYFRPVSHLLILITYSVFGENPIGYHVFNLSLLYLACLLLFALIAMTLKNKEIAFLTSIFFCAHPINGILVNYKNAPSYALLVVAAILALIHFVQAGRGRDPVVNRGLGMIWMLIALLCHELVIAFPFYLASILWFLENKSVKNVLKELTLPVAVMVLYLYSSLLDLLWVFKGYLA